MRSLFFTHIDIVLISFLSSCRLGILGSGRKHNTTEIGCRGMRDVALPLIFINRMNKIVLGLTSFEDPFSYILK